MGTPSGQAWRQEKADSRIQRKGRVGGAGGAGAPTGETWQHPPGFPPCVLPLVPSLQAETKGKGSTGHVGRPGRPSGLGSKGKFRFILDWGGQQVRGQDPVTQRPLEIVGKGTRCRPWGGTWEPRRCWTQAGARAVVSSERSRVSGDSVSRSRTGYLGCRLAQAPGISEGGGVGEEGESGPASRSCRVSAWWAGGPPYASKIRSSPEGSPRGSARPGGQTSEYRSRGQWF